MKKLFITIILAIMVAIGYGQSKIVVTHVVTDTGKYFTEYLHIGDFVYNQATKIMYNSSVDITPGAHKKLSWLLASSARYTSPTYTSTTLNSLGGTAYLDTINNQTAHGIKGFFGALLAYSTLNVTGATTAAAITCTSATVNGAFVVTGGETAAAINASGTITTPHLTSTTATITSSATIPYLIMTASTGHINTPYDSIGTAVISTRAKTASIYCTGSSGAIFTATDGTFWKLQISNVGLATYVTVTP